MTAATASLKTKLSDKSLRKTQAYINGSWQDADSGKTFPVYNPASGTVCAETPDMGAAETEKAVKAAYDAFPAWRALLATERASYLWKWARLIKAHADELAAILTEEQGKPLKEARGEVLGGASYVEWFAEEARRIYGDMIPTHKSTARVLVAKQPIGVVGAITPWNFPSAMITRKVAPALAAGCTVVLKPAEDAPLSALALAALAEEAGFPKGIFNVVTGSREAAPDIGEVLTTHPNIRKFSFTGSTAVGKVLAKQCTDTVKRVSLELGGNAPFIVFESADLTQAVKGAIGSKFRNAGQTCICANRIYVQDSVYDEFAALLVKEVKAMKVGPGAQEDSDIGPLINARGLEKVQKHLDDALSKGGELVCGGVGHEAGTLFFSPTVITGMTADMDIQHEETFGPIAGLFKFSDEDEVIQAANDTDYGLASYVYTNDLGQAFRVSEALEYGMVGVNEPFLAAPATPFGGVKQSGLGRENSKYGIDEFLEIKQILIGGI